MTDKLLMGLIIMGKGMLGIFVVIIIIMLITMIFNYVTDKKTKTPTEQ